MIYRAVLLTRTKTVYTEAKSKFNTLCVELDQDGCALEHYLVANN